MLPVLKRAKQGEVTNKTGVEAVASEFALTSEQLAELLPSGIQTKVSNRVAWGLTYMARAGLLERVRRGVYGITPRGRQILDTKPARIDNKVLKQFPEFLAFTKATSVEDAGSGQTSFDGDHDGSTSTPLEKLEEAYKSLSSTLSADVIDRILASSPVFFEKMVVKLLTEMGYGATIEEAAKHIGGPHDGGVDGVIHLDRLGIDKVYIQAKRYAPTTTVSRQDVQAFSGALDDKQTTRGVFITTSSFSSSALAYVKNITKQIVLIDGHRLAELLIRHGVGVRVERTLEVKRVDEDFFDDA
jgi:restriction system protein